MTHETTNEHWAASGRIDDEHACWELLRSAPFGRLAASMAGNPEIFPVNHVVDHGTLVFRTAKGTKLAAVTLHPMVAYEADGYDPVTHTAWSVVVKGRAVPVRQREELLETLFLPLHTWHEGSKPYFVRIVPDRVTMRRFQVSSPDSDPLPYASSIHE